MRNISTRFLQEGSLIEKSTEGYVFKKRFTRDEINENKHYLIKDENIILQINSNYRNVGCHDVGFDRVQLFRMTESLWLTLIKNVIIKDMKFVMNLSLDTDDSDAEDYFRYDLGVLNKGESTKEEYLNRVKENKDELFDVLESIVIYNIESNYQIQIYSSGAASIRAFGNCELDENSNEVLLLGKLLGLYESFDDLDEILMIEKGIKEHPYSKLHVLMDYLKENKESLPKDVVDALNNGLEDSLTKTGKNHKGLKTYIN